MKTKSTRPYALSVAKVVEFNDVAATANKILSFDDREFGFSHSATWSALPSALEGHLTPDAVERQYKDKVLSPVYKAIEALAEFGLCGPAEVFRFEKFAELGFSTLAVIQLGVDLRVRVQRPCWYVEDGRPIIPILQPHLDNWLSGDRLGIYMAMVKIACCKDDFADAIIEVIDLSLGSSKRREATAFRSNDAGIRIASVDELTDYLQIYVDALQIVEDARAERDDTKPRKEEAGVRVSDLPLFRGQDD